jgi:hypothetical protein
VWGKLAAKIPDSISLIHFFRKNEKAAGPVVSHNISPDELEKAGDDSRFFALLGSAPQ